MKRLFRFGVISTLAVPAMALAFVSGPANAATTPPPATCSTGVSAPTNTYPGTTVAANNFESGTLDGFTVNTGTTGTATIDNTQAHSGTCAAHLHVTTDPGSLANLVTTLPANSNDVYADAWFNITTAGVAGNDVPYFRFFFDTTRFVDIYRYNSNGQMWLRVTSSAGFTYTNLVPGSIALNAWRHVGMHVIANGAASTVEVWLDGTSIFSSNQIDTTATTVTAVQLGAEHLTQMGDEYIDDFVIKTGGTAPGGQNPGADAITAAATTAGIGTATGTVVCGLTAGGCYQNYTGGVIHWTATTGAFATKGAIDAAWAALGWETGALGYPTSNEIGGLKNGGVYQNFQHGVIHWSPATGAHATKGAIDAAWAAQNWENGGLGYPTSNEIALKNGAYQTFEGGVIHWSPATGAHITQGAIDAAWAGLNWENGFLGYPTSNEIGNLKNGGVYQNFQGGVIYWSAGSGAHANAGAIRTAYASQGWENGRLGYPTTNEYASGAGVAQDYQGGRITWSAGTGTAITYK
ncbi:LGFP repeat-containing protein [Arthrobacter sp. 92]|uniref:LGFP repeat-containing protein n=1 Tax=Arthrobacter sp. 92 TaxID=3418175 RepID=UPI003D0089DB